MPSAADRVATPEPALLDVRDAAVLCGFSPKHVRRLSSTGQMPAPAKLGRILRWSRQELLTWIADGCPHWRKAERSHRSTQ